MNPCFEVYMLKKEKEWNKIREAIVVAIIIENLLIRPFNTDVFMLRQMVSRNETDMKPHKYNSDILHSIRTNDYHNIAYYILTQSDNNSIESLYENCIDELDKIYGNLQKPRLIKKFNIIYKHKATIRKEILLAKIISVFATKIKTKGKNLYIHVEPSEIVIYETLCDSDIKSYRFLNKVCLFGINDSNQLHLFDLNRRHCNDVQELFNNEWLFYASFSKIWMARMKECNGYCDYVNKKVIFTTDDDEENFYNKYNYEPDEQSLSLKNKTIPNLYDCKKMDNMSENTWSKFQEKYNKHGLLVISKEEIDKYILERGVKYNP